ncbi:molybdopterin-synthase adenylyltransferase MoeB [Acetobacter sp. AN02]|uniref:HesA/MoeB/ThiF family protein n=1 Tax=Acetobacter sp. AN02 TaxID=2894186 RepID=UPI0024346849|nr:molybdopterin-synthase adenylyltransferase MoeB [Acetobacter sp. AN02]MDG6093577.1 molybdopterin-synthase adenylyltransferase MoeB [Acetobacter sp. AN02]
MQLNEDQITRYSRHILLPEVGGTGQEKLLSSSVLIIGAGGLGSPVALYLAAAGVGRLGLADDDHVDLSNLQRQILHTTARVGDKKTDSARDAITALNSDVRLDLIPHRLTDPAELRRLIRSYDIVCDGSDNFTTRYLVSDACVAEGKSLISAAVRRFEGQLMAWKPGTGCGCYRCIFPERDGTEGELTCSEAGVFGAVTGVMGTLQASETLKELLGIGETMAGHLLMWDALDMRFTTLQTRRDPDCPACGKTEEQKQP